MDTYEKKYNEALELARKIHSGEGVDAPAGWSTLETIFPELRESEDERIRRDICTWLKHKRETCTYPTPKEATLSTWIAYLEKQKEQKPAEKQDYSGLNDLERVIHRGFLSAGVENVPVTIIKETAKECLAQMKPAWSEEDEKNLELVTDCVYEFYPDPVMKYKLKDWLSKRLKSLRPSWKPSEEQMKALEIAFRKDGDDKYRSTINSLYNDLKKL